MKCSPRIKCFSPTLRWKVTPVDTTRHRHAIGYIRLSDRAARGGECSLERQEAEIRRWCESNGLKLTSVKSDIGTSGKKVSRAGLNDAISECALRGALLVSYSLDRLARDVKVLERLKSERVAFRALDVPEASEHMIDLMLIFARMYSDQISNKMKAYHKSRKEAVARGEMTPHPVPKPAPNIEAARRTIAHARETRVARTQKRAGYVWNHIRPMVESGASLHEIAARLNDDGVTAPRGGQWYAAGVARIVSRHSA